MEPESAAAHHPVRPDCAAGGGPKSTVPRQRCLLVVAKQCDQFGDQADQLGMPL